MSEYKPSSEHFAASCENIYRIAKMKIEPSRQLQIIREHNIDLMEYCIDDGHINEDGLKRVRETINNLRGIDYVRKNHKNT